MPSTTTTTLDRPLGSPSYAPRVSHSRVAWLPWTDPNPIATTRHERTFAGELAQIAGAPADSHARSDTTAVLNALRGGLTVEQLLENAPGLRPTRLHRAYQDLEERRRVAVEAWQQIAAEPTVASLHEHGQHAAKLVPVLVHRLLETADIDEGLLPRVAAHLVSGVDEVQRLVHNTELELDRRLDPVDAMAISRTLYDPTSDCIFARVEHLPTRVGSLVPTRVAALLNEHVQGLALLS